MLSKAKHLKLFLTATANKGQPSEILRFAQKDTLQKLNG